MIVPDWLTRLLARYWPAYFTAGLLFTVIGILTRSGAPLATGLTGIAAGVLWCAIAAIIKSTEGKS